MARVARLLLVAMLCCTAVAHGNDETVLARQHFDKALTHLRNNELREALAELELAQKLRPHHSVLYNIGKVHVALGDPLSAIDALEACLALGGASIDPGRRAEIEQIIRDQLAKVARVTLTVAPAGAMISVDRKPIGKSPLPGPLRLSPGHHELSVALAGYRSETRSIDLGAGSEQPIDLTLVRSSKPTELGAVAIDCPILDVTIEVDGRAQARTPTRTILVPIGAREIVFQRSGYVSSKHALLVDRTGSAVVRCRLHPSVPLAANRSGRIEIALDAPHALVLDGQGVSQIDRVPHGRHRIELRAPGRRPWSREVYVRAGNTLRLEPELLPDDDTLRARQSQRTLAYTLGATGIGVLAAAGVMYVWNTTRYQEWSDEQSDLNTRAKDVPPNPDLERDQTLNDELLESIRLFDRVTLGIAIVGGGFLIGGGALYFTGDDPAPKSQPVITTSAGGSIAGWRWIW